VEEEDTLAEKDEEDAVAAAAATTAAPDRNIAGPMEIALTAQLNATPKPKDTSTMPPTITCRVEAQIIVTGFDLGGL
jgi:hypothetical protein